MSRPSLLVIVVSLIASVAHKGALVSANQAPASAQGQPVYGAPNQWGQPPGPGDEQQGYYGSQQVPPGPQQQNQGMQSGQQYATQGMDPSVAPYGGAPPGPQMGYGSQGQYGNQYGAPPPGMDMGGPPPGFGQPQRMQEDGRGGGGGGINFGGLLNRAKNIAATAASAASTFVAGGPDLVGPPGFQEAPPQGQYGQQQPPIGQQDPFGGPPGPQTQMGGPPGQQNMNMNMNMHYQDQQGGGRGLGDAVADGVGSIFGKVKGFFSDEDGRGPVQAQGHAPSNPFGAPPLPGSGDGGGGGDPFGPPPGSAPFGQGQGPQESPFDPFGTPPPPGTGADDSMSGPAGAGGDPSWGFQPPSNNPAQGTYGDASGFQQHDPFGPPPAQQQQPPPPSPQQQQQQYQQQSQQQYQQQYQQQQHQQQQQQQGPPIPPEPERPPPPTIIPEPQLIKTGSGIVLILDPVEFYRKKEIMTTAGANSLQVFSDFEHVLTKNRIAVESGASAHSQSQSGSCAQPVMSDMEARTLGTAEVLEGSQSLSPSAQEKLRELTDVFLSSEVAMDDEAFESYTSQTQQIITADGSLHIAALPEMTSEAIPKMGFREGWTNALKSLTQRGVPTFVFSSGYGDIVTQALLQGGVVQPQQAQATQYQQAIPASLPLNMRIISNFCRTGPDGTVRAFSSPVVHERNKNAATAAAALGFALPERPNAIVLGSHEDDALMTTGAAGINEKLSIGFIEVQDDFVSRLPGYLGAYDAVVIGEGEFTFVANLIDDILGIPVPKQESTARAIQNRLGDGLGRARGFFRGLDLGSGGFE